MQCLVLKDVSGNFLPKGRKRFAFPNIFRNIIPKFCSIIHETIPHIISMRFGKHRLLDMSRTWYSTLSLLYQNNLVRDCGPILFNTLYIIFPLAFFLSIWSGSQPYPLVIFSIILAALFCSFWSHCDCVSPKTSHTSQQELK